MNDPDAWECLAGEADLTCCQHNALSFAGELGDLIVACCETCGHVFYISDRPLRNGRSALERHEWRLAERIRDFAREG